MVSLSVPSSSTDVCTTQGCIQSALNILADMDFNIDPCSDFYQYTCGGWLKNATIPDSESSVGTFYHLRDANAKVIENILTNTYQEMTFNDQKEKEADISNFNMVKNYYQSCMNQDQIDQLGREPLEKYLLPIKQQDTLGALIQLEITGGSNPLFSASVDPDDRNPNQNIITLMQPSLGLPSKEYFEQKQYVEIYRKSIKQLANLTMPDLNEPEIDAAIDFETQLAAMSTSLEGLQDPISLYNPFTLEDLENKYSYVNWRTFFQGVMSRTPNKIVVMTPSYFDKLGELWQDQNTVVIKNYILLSTMRHHVYLLDRATNDVLQEMNNKLSGRKSSPTRQRTCIQRTNDAFGELLGHYFVNRVFGINNDDNDTAGKIHQLLESIRTIYAQRLESVDWLDDATRAKALDKIQKMAIKSMYSTQSPDIRSPLSLQQYYGDLNSIIRPDTQFENALALASWAANKSWSSFDKMVDKDRWFMEPQAVNAYFSPTYNQVVVPAGILQPPFYDINSIPLSLGGIGVVIGHELTHGFDNSGRLYDGDGVLSQWWSNATMEQFNEKAQCFIDQYNGFNIQGPDGQDHHVNGKMTLGENLADNGGISLAYEAFSKTPQLRLSGLDLSPEALFFINFGRVWCEKDRPERAIQKILGDVHSPARVRVNAVVQNMPDFAKAFNCPAGAPMNPIKKCKVW
ncbi:uncharacterized protein BX664DRAFT_362351 [Halteromyces radiatus]|uniref:uncharacterized protein n=1 Tax=Halteromyces radiatus TaxID=101107 RepID=UPI002221231C|nr:uncharacterized protein BX664DRAFT_362351 [Halteromyces radiatus]KAI8078789.1 hypothetical protein BX664DRAFT_362351 [Halteromyces radiatus]